MADVDLSNNNNKATSNHMTYEMENNIDYQEYLKKIKEFIKEKNQDLIPSLNDDKKIENDYHFIKKEDNVYSPHLNNFQQGNFNRIYNIDLNKNLFGYDKSKINYDNQYNHYYKEFYGDIKNLDENHLNNNNDNQIINNDLNKISLNTNNNNQTNFDNNFNDRINQINDNNRINSNDIQNTNINKNNNSQYKPEEIQFKLKSDNFLPQNSFNQSQNIYNNNINKENENSIPISTKNPDLIHQGNNYLNNNQNYIQGTTKLRGFTPNMNQLSNDSNVPILNNQQNMIEVSNSNFYGPNISEQEKNYNTNSPNLNSISNKYKTQSPNQQELDDQFKTINYSITPNLNDEKSKFSTNDNLYLNNNYNSIDSNQGFYHPNQSQNSFNENLNNKNQLFYQNQVNPQFLGNNQYQNQNKMNQPFDNNNNYSNSNLQNQSFGNNSLYNTNQNLNQISQSLEDNNLYNTNQSMNNLNQRNNEINQSNQPLNNTNFNNFNERNHPYNNNFQNSQYENDNILNERNQQLDKDVNQRNQQYDYQINNTNQTLPFDNTNTFNNSNKQFDNNNKTFTSQNQKDNQFDTNNMNIPFNNYNNNINDLSNKRNFDKAQNQYEMFGKENLNYQKPFNDMNNNYNPNNFEQSQNNLNRIENPNLNNQSNQFNQFNDNIDYSNPQNLNNQKPYNPQNQNIENNNNNENTNNNKINESYSSQNSSSSNTQQLNTNNIENNPLVSSNEGNNNLNSEKNSLLDLKNLPIPTKGKRKSILDTDEFRKLIVNPDEEGFSEMKVANPFTSPNNHYVLKEKDYNARRGIKEKNLFEDETESESQKSNNNIDYDINNIMNNPLTLGEENKENKEDNNVKDPNNNKDNINTKDNKNENEKKKEEDKKKKLKKLKSIHTMKIDKIHHLPFQQQILILYNENKQLTNELDRYKALFGDIDALEATEGIANEFRNLLMQENEKLKYLIEEGDKIIQDFINFINSFNERLDKDKINLDDVKHNKHNLAKFFSPLKQEILGHIERSLKREAKNDLKDLVNLNEFQLTDDDNYGKRVIEKLKKLNTNGFVGADGNYMLNYYYDKNPKDCIACDLGYNNSSKGYSPIMCSPNYAKYVSGVNPNNSDY